MAYGRILDAFGPIEAVHREVDTWIAAMPEDDRTAIPCKKGCAYCCYQFMLVSLPETMYMIKNLIQEPQGRKWLKDHAPVFNQQVQMINGFEESKLESYRAKWFDASTPCAFLDMQTNSCVIYKTRPVICRSYFVNTSPEQCAGPSGTRVAILDNSRLIAKIVIASMQVAAEFKISAALFPLPLAVLWSLVGYLSGLGYMRHAIKTKGMNVSVKL